jgi:hypothetical protein
MSFQSSVSSSPYEAGAGPKLFGRRLPRFFALLVPADAGIDRQAAPRTRRPGRSRCICLYLTTLSR